MPLSTLGLSVRWRSPEWMTPPDWWHKGLPHTHRHTAFFRKSWDHSQLQENLEYSKFWCCFFIFFKENKLFLRASQFHLKKILSRWNIRDQPFGWNIAPFTHALISVQTGGAEWVDSWWCCLTRSLMPYPSLPFTFFPWYNSYWHTHLQKTIGTKSWAAGGVLMHHSACVKVAFLHACIF